jgi:hypothetical protein
MAQWSSVGHGIRRRLGLPSNHLEATGRKMSRKHATSDEVYQQHANAGSPRIPMGMSAFTLSGSSVPQGTLVPKKSVQAADPTNPGSKVNRVNELYDPERIGAAYRIKTNFLPTTDPAAGATTRNARIVSSVAGRQAPNFGAGIQASEL